MEEHVQSVTDLITALATVRSMATGYEGRSDAAYALSQAQSIKDALFAHDLTRASALADELVRFFGWRTLPGPAAETAHAQMNRLSAQLKGARLEGAPEVDWYDDRE